jgi:hypothetical protein
MTVGFYCRAGLIRAQFVAATLRLQLDRSRSIQLIGNSRQLEVHERDLPLERSYFPVVGSVRLEPDFRSA